MIENITIALLLAFIAVQEYLNRKERKGLMDRIMAKDLTDLKVAEKIEKEKPLKAPELVPPDFIEPSQVGDAEFDLAIKKELGRESLIEKAKEKLRRKNG